MQFQDIFNWMFSVGVQYGYFGVFGISLVGAVSILFPVPDSLVVFVISGLKIGEGWMFEPFFVAAAAGIGSAFGEFSGYLLGFSGSKVLAGNLKNMDFLARILRRFGSLAIFIFALTPLPDDMVFIPLGVMHYNPAKALAPALAGKFMMSLVVAYAGRFSIGFVRDVFGGNCDFVISFIIFAVGVFLTIAMFKLDWGKYFEKHLFKRSIRRQ